MQGLWAARRMDHAAVKNATAGQGALIRALSLRRRRLLIQPRMPYMQDPPIGKAHTGIAWSDRPMTTFDKREETFEKKFAHDEELRFKATARRNKYLGQWVAEKLGLSGAEAEAYVRTVIIADLDEPGDHDIFRKVRADLDAKGLTSISDGELRRTMDELLNKAAEEIKAGK
jgi:hypothetical protein